MYLYATHARIMLGGHARRCLLYPVLLYGAVSAQRAAAAKRLRTEVKLVTCAQLFEAGS